jgi:8-oxo-dGTP pyrophosphatase MutT (NUDIX family)
LPALLTSLKRRSFWIVARTCFQLYRWFPLFGSLRASIAIIQREGKFLVIDRNDGRGLGLPGGIANWREKEEATLHREVREETGLAVTSAEFRMRYHASTDVPCDISVFEVTASGELRESWEGPPRWMSAAEIEPRLLKSQRPVVDLLRKMETGESSR